MLLASIMSHTNYWLGSFVFPDDYWLFRGAEKPYAGCTFSALYTDIACSHLLFGKQSVCVPHLQQTGWWKKTGREGDLSNQITCKQ